MAEGIGWTKEGEFYNSRLISNLWAFL